MINEIGLSDCMMYVRFVIFFPTVWKHYAKNLPSIMISRILHNALFCQEFKKKKKQTKQYSSPLNEDMQIFRCHGDTRSIKKQKQAHSSGLNSRTAGSSCPALLSKSVSWIIFKSLSWFCGAALLFLHRQDASHCLFPPLWNHIASLWFSSKHFDMGKVMCTVPLFVYFF